MIISPSSVTDIDESDPDGMIALKAAKNNRTTLLIDQHEGHLIRTKVRSYQLISGSNTNNGYVFGDGAALYAQLAGPYKLHVADIHMQGNGMIRIKLDRYKAGTGERITVTGTGSIRDAAEYAVKMLYECYPNPKERTFDRS